MSFGSFVLLPNIIGGSSYLPFESTTAIQNKNPAFGAFKAYQQVNLLVTDSKYKNTNELRWADLWLYANLGNSLYGASNSVQPQSLVLNYVIKY